MHTSIYLYPQPSNHILLIHWPREDVLMILKIVISEYMLWIKFISACEIEKCHRTHDKSTLVEAEAWYHQARSHYLSQCWPIHHMASLIHNKLFFLYKQAPNTASHKKPPPRQETQLPSSPISLKFCVQPSWKSYLTITSDLCMVELSPMGTYSYKSNLVQCSYNKVNFLSKSSQ